LHLPDPVYARDFSARPPTAASRSADAAFTIHASSDSSSSPTLPSSRPTRARAIGMSVRAQDAIATRRIGYAFPWVAAGGAAVVAGAAVAAAGAGFVAGGAAVLRSTGSLCAFGSGVNCAAVCIAGPSASAPGTPSGGNAFGFQARQYSGPIEPLRLSCEQLGGRLFVHVDNVARDARQGNAQTRIGAAVRHAAALRVLLGSDELQSHVRFLPVVCMKRRARACRGEAVASGAPVSACRAVS
jgi:hypothetical protein